MNVFNDLTAYNKYLNLAEPLHPLMDSRVCKQAIPNFPPSSNEIQVNLYKISLKKNFTGDIKYGKASYKTDNGLMLLSEPGQVVSWDALTFWDGYAFVFHPDLIKKHSVATKITQYKYFSYEINDALFMTAEEEQTITWLFTKIHYELVDNKNKTNEDIILSLLNVILTYADLYYKRQFSETESHQTSVSSKVKMLLQRHYNDLSKPVANLPSVSSIARELHLSPNYLTDLVRTETGKSTIQLIHDYILEQAEILLLQTNLNVSDIAYQLGFENVPYFSKLFKKNKGFSPTEIRNQGNG
ncbi:MULTISPECIES: AraC family transcriptional regulator [unclassified Spirosoma]|uniref:helix-turn-helix domain-containing protein n=1 Tax=unclassified Spirosoma TaxID=2621999 RepID=UPI00095F100C|nr:MULTISPECIES: AraC family transcriptional regulator [unclassified Spirosoma]MBN8822650.1 helix-turn-helix transcriptional regulator [Spirosoma sp.]OJW74139.1 MAG: AraC family transcriptional regulator [Spirosoma sp. 48-14]